MTATVREEERRTTPAGDRQVSDGGDENLRAFTAKGDNGMPRLVAGGLTYQRYDDPARATVSIVAREQAFSPTMLDTCPTSTRRTETTSFGSDV